MTASSVLEDEEFDGHREIGARTVSEYRMRTRDGREVWIRDEGVCIANERNEPALYRGFMIDISAQKEAELALRESEEQTRLIIETREPGLHRHRCPGRRHRLERTGGGDLRLVPRGGDRPSRSRTASSRSRSAPPTGPGWRRSWPPGEGPLVGKRIEVTALHRDGHEFLAELTIWPVGTRRAHRRSAR